MPLLVNGLSCKLFVLLLTSMLRTSDSVPPNWWPLGLETGCSPDDKLKSGPALRVLAEDRDDNGVATGLSGMNGTNAPAGLFLELKSSWECVLELCSSNPKLTVGSPGRRLRAWEDGSWEFGFCWWWVHSWASAIHAGNPLLLLRGLSIHFSCTSVTCPLCSCSSSCSCLSHLFFRGINSSNTGLSVGGGVDTLLSVSSPERLRSCNGWVGISLLLSEANCSIELSIAANDTYVHTCQRLGQVLNLHANVQHNSKSH